MYRSMTMATTVDMILDEIAELSLEDQEMLDEIVHKRIVEEKRSDIRADYMAAVEDRKQGRTKTGSVDDLFGAVG